MGDVTPGWPLPRSRAQPPRSAPSPLLLCRFPGAQGRASPPQRGPQADPGVRYGLRRGVRAAGTVLLPWAPASVAVARQRLAADLSAAGIFDTAVGDAVLVVSELLSNAIRHARPLPGASVQVAWAVGAGAIEVAVSDGGAPTTPVRAHATVSSLGGRGLDIVEYLARRWGVRSDDSGQTVWAVLAAPAAVQPSTEPTSAVGRR
jgi:anti-sigma regulatory factor (Ser/Thr protein kinase)